MCKLFQNFFVDRVWKWQNLQAFCCVPNGSAWPRLSGAHGKIDLSMGAS